MDTFDTGFIESDDDDNSILSAVSIGWNCSAATRSRSRHCHLAYDNDYSDIADDGNRDGNKKVDSNNFFSAVSFVVSNIAREITDGPLDDNERDEVATSRSTADANTKFATDNSALQVPRDGPLDENKRAAVATENSALQVPSNGKKEEHGNGAALDKSDALVNEEKCKGTVIDAGNQTSFVHIVESDNSSERLLSQTSSSSLSNTSQILKTPSKLPRFKLRSSRPSKKERAKEQQRKEQQRIAAANAERRERRRNMTVTRITITQE